MNLDAGPPAVRFDTVHRALALFAQALHGEGRALQRDDGPAHDDASIRLPPVIADFASERENRGAYRLAVLRQLDRATAPVPGFNGWPRRRLLRRVFMRLEDLRIDSALARRYPGARVDLQRAQALALTRRGAPPSATRPMHGIVDALVRFTLGVAPAAPGADPTRGRVLAIAAQVRHAAADASDSVRAAHAICACLEAPGRRTQRDVRPGEMAVPPGEDPDDGLPGGRGNADMQPAMDAAEGAADGGWNAALAFSIDGAARARDIASRPAAPVARQPEPLSGHGYFYDEWNSVEHRYLPDWCRVVERRLRGADLAFQGDVRERHAALAARVRRQFAAIRPASRERLYRAYDGEDIDIDRVIAEAVERRAGQQSDGRVFTAQQRPRRDVCAAFLVDMSGSTGFLVPPPAGSVPAAVPDEDDYYLYAPRVAPAAVPEPPRRRVIDVAKDAMALMCDALHTLGDRHAVYGFSGEGRHRVDFLIAKAFGDAWSPRTAAALSAMQPMGATRTGAAIRHAVRRLAREPAQTRVLIVVSDGYPQDADYGPDPRDPGYGIQDTARALREAEQAGIATFCIAIDPAGHDYLRTMSREDRYLVIDDVTALPEQLGKVYRALTTR
ncbi:nitric oxide reductase activation protein NorD [Variovorax sp. PAMC 28711]|uniref:nitric oxide reductase activation protein NorD n=1 Tax=Variovorax sp. PAMC 28711 TaxID=1795631 RepID=UPI00078D6AEB|nr:VWA domain-containing protein [Variovorax sp. PAMC 28711]AMM24446.1 hypothetical protein AX767_08850 [Variovorax sp. PAMC 28711]